MGKTAEGSPRNDQRPETAPRPADVERPDSEEAYEIREVLGEHSSTVMARNTSYKY